MKTSILTLYNKIQKRNYNLGQAIGQKAREHARKTHDPQKNLEDLMAIYGELKERSR